MSNFKLNGLSEKQNEVLEEIYTGVCLNQEVEDKFIDLLESEVETEGKVSPLASSLLDRMNAIKMKGESIEGAGRQLMSKDLENCNEATDYGENEQ